MATVARLHSHPIVCNAAFGGCAVRAVVEAKLEGYFFVAARADEAITMHSRRHNEGLLCRKKVVCSESPRVAVAERCRSPMVAKNGM